LQQRKTGTLSPFLLVIEKEKIADFVSGKLKDTDCFLVDVQVSSRKVSVFIDRNEGISVTECARLNRELQKEYESSGLLETHDLIVSSPGLEYPFKVEQQYFKNVGRKVKISTTDGTDAEGVLKEFKDGICTLIIPAQNKKTEQQEKVIPLTDIKETKIIIQI